MTRRASRPRRHGWPWPMLWILAAVGHALGGAPHPQSVPLPPPVILAPQQLTPTPQPLVPSDDPDWDWGPEQARRGAS
jgi:hypothetical protein